MDLETLLWRKFRLDHGGADFQQRGEVLKLCLAGRMVLVLASEVKFSTSINKVYYYTAIMKPIRLCQRLCVLKGSRL